MVVVCSRFLEIVIENRKKKMISSLYDECVLVININIRFRDRLDILKENYILPNCLVEVCKNRYEDDLLNKQARLYRKIRESPSYVWWAGIVNQPLISYDKIEIHIDRFRISEIFGGVAGHYCVRHICRSCYEMYYSSENWSKNISINCEEKRCFIPSFHFEYKFLELWCNDCIQPIFKLPKGTLSTVNHDAIVQVAKNHIDERQFRRTHKSMSASVAMCTPPPSPLSSIHSYESDESDDEEYKAVDANLTFQLYKILTR